MVSLNKKIVKIGDKLAFSWKVRQGLYKHLSAQVGNTISVEDSLDNYRLRLQRHGRVSSDKIVSDVSRRMRDGDSLATALANWIPVEEVNIISSGEMSGDLPASLELLIESKRRSSAVIKAARSAMIQPIIYMIVVAAFIWALGFFIIPDLQFVLPEERAKGMALAMFKVSKFANSWWALIPPVLIFIFIYIIIYSLPRWTGAYRIKIERYFPYSFYRDINGYVWLMGFTALLRAGMADVTILKNQSKYATPWLKERINTIWWRMDNGSSLSGALLTKSRAGIPMGFPNPDIVDDISSMDGFSDFPERISNIAFTWAKDLEESLLQKARTFGILSEVAMYGVIALLLISVNSLSEQIGSVNIR